MIAASFVVVGGRQGPLQGAGSNSSVSAAVLDQAWASPPRPLRRAATSLGVGREPGLRPLADSQNDTLRLALEAQATLIPYIWPN